MLAGVLIASRTSLALAHIVPISLRPRVHSFQLLLSGKDGTIIALSALLTTTMTEMKKVIEALEAAGVRDKVKVMIGGAPITQQYADEIGADGYSDNASGAVATARKLTG